MNVWVEFPLDPTQWRLLFIFLRVNHPHVSDQTLKCVWQVCFSKITAWCVYESLCAVKQKTLRKSLHVGPNQCLFLFDSTFWFMKYQWTREQIIVSSGHPVKHRQSQTQELELFHFVKTRAHLATIWPACTLCCHIQNCWIWKDLYLQRTSDVMTGTRSRISKRVWIQIYAKR